MELFKIEGALRHIKHAYNDLMIYLSSYTFMDSYLSFLNAKCELLDFPINLFLHLLTISDGCFHRQMTKSIFQVLLLKETFHQSSRKSRLSKFPPWQSFFCRRFTNIWNDTVAYYCTMSYIAKIVGKGDKFYRSWTNTTSQDILV